MRLLVPGAICAATLVCGGVVVTGVVVVAAGAGVSWAVGAALHHIRSWLS